MTALDVFSGEVTTAAASAVKWLNRQTDSIHPYVLESITQATRLDSGNIEVQVTLVVAPTRTFRFVLELNPVINNPTGLVRKRQLA
jgi:ribosome-associated translation inhibitor RaiA